MNVLQVTERGNCDGESGELVSAMRCSRDEKLMTKQCHVDVEGKHGGIKRRMNIENIIEEGPSVRTGSED